MTDSPSPVFTMQSMRAVVRAYPDFGARLENEIQAIEDNVGKNPEICIALAKKLVETCCKTVLTERDKPPSGDETIQALFKATLNELGFFVPGHPDNKQISDSVKKAGHGLQNAIVGIAEIRNIQGVDHGAPADWPNLLPAHAAFVGTTVDAVGALLLETHRSESAARKTPLRYDDNPEFNDFIDEEHEAISLFGTDYRPSEILFTVDQIAYETYLAGFQVYEPDEDAAVDAVAETAE